MDIKIADTILCAAGNTVVFDDEGSYVENKRTGERVAMVSEKGCLRVVALRAQGFRNAVFYKGRERGRE